MLPAVHEQVAKQLGRHPSRQIDEQVETEETQRQHLMESSEIQFEQPLHAALAAETVSSTSGSEES
jgi:hypothetical protein